MKFDGVLQYGGKDSALKGNIRKKVEEWEKKFRQEKNEHLLLTDEKGNTIEENEGAEQKCKVPMRAIMVNPNCVMTHTHPRMDNLKSFGGTFSEQDIDGFIRGDARTLRAAAREGTYSISKTSSYTSQKGRALSNMVQKAYKKAEEKRKKDYEKARQKAIDGGIKELEEFTKIRDNGFNNMMIAVHNALLANQKKYGYTYTLEKAE